MLVTVEYYASLREKSGVPREEVETTANDAAGLFGELAARYGFAVRPDSMRVAVNDEITSWDQPLSRGDTVVFLTPFGGG